jgi:hypothetical protein
LHKQEKIFAPTRQSVIAFRGEKFNEISFWHFDALFAGDANSFGSA